MDSWMNFWCFGYVWMHRCALITGGRMLDEWREKFVLSQQEAIEIYTEMHRHLASHGPIVRRSQRMGFGVGCHCLLPLLWIPIFSIWRFSVFSPRSEVWSCSQERIWSSTKSNLAVPGLDTRERRVATDNYLGETQGTSAFIFQRFSRSLLGSWCFFHAFSLIAFSIVITHLKPMAWISNLKDSVTCQTLSLSSPSYLRSFCVCGVWRGTFWRSSWLQSMQSFYLSAWHGLNALWRVVPWMSCTRWDMVRNGKRVRENVRV